jgi:geranylgeranyl pyrophosphate synthase
MILSGRCVEMNAQINQLIENIRASSAVGMAMQEAYEFIDRGLAALNAFPASPARDSLHALATFFLRREL